MLLGNLAGTTAPSPLSSLLPPHPYPSSLTHKPSHLNPQPTPSHSYQPTPYTILIHSPTPPHNYQPTHHSTYSPINPHLTLLSPHNPQPTPHTPSTHSPHNHQPTPHTTIKPLPTQPSAHSPHNHQPTPHTTLNPLPTQPSINQLHP